MFVLQMPNVMPCAKGYRESVVFGRGHFRTTYTRKNLTTSS